MSIQDNGGMTELCNQVLGVFENIENIARKTLINIFLAILAFACEEGGRGAITQSISDLVGLF